MYRVGAFDAFADANYKALKTMPEARYIYDCILSNDATISAMIEAAKEDEPSLTVCIHRIDNYIKGQPNPSFALYPPDKQDFNHQLLGKMVADILRDYGYTPVESRPVPQGTPIIKTAHIYTLDKSKQSYICACITIPC